MSDPKKDSAENIYTTSAFARIFPGTCGNKGPSVFFKPGKMPQVVANEAGDTRAIADSCYLSIADLKKRQI